ncbi:Holliday junction resolvase [Yersinia phage fHe-Yen9-02]|nr:Holliday junction resolvase [Yersinia phage fHe-Yen9-02]
MRILAGDPGKVNFALSIIEVNGTKIEFLGTRMFNRPIQNLTGDMRQVTKEFLDEIRKIDKQYGPFDGMCFERFQSRGLGGNTIEAISLMLGVLCSYALTKKIPIDIITASQWKNAFNRTMDLKGLYEEFKLTSKKSPKAIHEFDASLIGVYKFYKQSNIKPFVGMNKVIYPMIEKFLTCPTL